MLVIFQSSCRTSYYRLHFCSSAFFEQDTADVFTEQDLRLVSISSYGEVKQTLARLASEAQSQKWRVSEGDLIRVCLLGGDALVSLALRAYVDQLSSRSADLASAFRFYVVPLPGGGTGVRTHSVPTQGIPSTTQALPVLRHRNQTCTSATRLSYPARPLPETVNSSFGSEAWSDTDSEPNWVSCIRAWVSVE